MKRYLSLAIVGGLMGLAVSGCDSSLVSQSSPPPPVQPSTTTPDSSSGSGGKPSDKPHGPDTEDHDVAISDVRGHQFTLLVNDDTSLNQLVGRPGQTPAFILQNGKVVNIAEGSDEGYCSFTRVKSDPFKVGDKIEMTDLEMKSGFLTATSNDKDVVMSCENGRSEETFRVSDLDRILGEVATVQLAPRTF